MRWRTRAGDEVEARLGQPDTKDVISQAWRTALDPGGEWISAALYMTVSVVCSVGALLTAMAAIRGMLV